MDEHAGEKHFCNVEGRRKGRGRSPCYVKAGVSLNTEQQVILRAEDQSGTASLVALLSPDQALILADALMQSAEAVEAAVGGKAGLSQRPPVVIDKSEPRAIRKAAG
jgi:hypothetical protein